MGNAQPLGFHGTGYHLIGLSCTDTMRQERIAAIQGMGNRILLMGAELDIRCHAGEGQIRAIVLTRPDVVEMAVVIVNKGFLAVFIFPEPILKGLPQIIHFELCLYGTFLVDAPLFFSVFNDRLIYFRLLEVQGQLTEIQRIDGFRAVGLIDFGIV